MFSVRQEVVWIQWLTAEIPYPC